MCKELFLSLSATNFTLKKFTAAAAAVMSSLTIEIKIIEN
jgi:hypothetical protein